jgi:hypothetical protein
MSDIANPFVETTTGAYFVGREAELEKFRANLGGLKNRLPNHEYVAGMEGTGKSYYLRKLVELAHAEGFIALVLSLDSGVSAYSQVRTVVGRVIDETQRQTTVAGKPLSHQLRDDWDSGPAAKQFRTPKQELLIIDDLRHDFGVIGNYATGLGAPGVVVCLDEGQRIEPLALSGLKNALTEDGRFQVVLSWRLASDAGGAIEAGRRELHARATTAEQDQGAARMFVAGTGMGPFATEQDVQHFFATRLEGKAIQFEVAVSTKLGEIADRIPGRMVALANRVFERGLKDRVTNVGVPTLDDCFREYYPAEVKQAVDLRANLPEDLAEILKSLCKFGKPATALELVNHAFAVYPETIRAAIAAGESQRLTKFCEQTGVLLKADDTFCVTSNIYRYALKIAMGLT